MTTHPPIFKHPLARKAKVWTSKSREGADQRLLIVVTTLDLNPSDKRYQEKQVERLKGAIEDYIAAAPELAGYALVNRPKEWDD